MPFQESIASRSDLPKAQRQTKQAIEQVRGIVGLAGQGSQHAFWWTRLIRARILDPACGFGAFFIFQTSIPKTPAGANASLPKPASSTSDGARRSRPSKKPSAQTMVINLIY
jgi:hypothetical protein